MTNINNIINDKNDKQWQNGDEMTKNNIMTKNYKMTKKIQTNSWQKWQILIMKCESKNDKYQ